MQTRDLVIVSSAASMAVGAAVGYFVANKKAEQKWKAKADEEILSVKKHYGMVHDPNDYDTPEEAAEADRRRVHDYLERLDELDYRAGLKPGPGPEVAEAEVLPEPVPVEDQLNDPGSENFDKAYPYPVSSDEFFMDHEDYPKITLNYYELDDILCDDRDEVINNRGELIGTCLKFMGYDKTEPNAVYVINHKIGVAYEVCRDPDAYQTIVQGIPFS